MKPPIPLKSKVVSQTAPIKTVEKKSKIPYIFVVFFAVVFAVNAFYIYLSKKTWRGVATEHAYQKGLQYNEVIKQSREQEKLGWEIKTKYSSIATRKGTILITIRDQNQQIIPDAFIVINFRRPTQEGLEFSPRVEPVSGMYKSAVDFPLQGQWEADFIIQKDDITIKQTQRFVIQ